MDLKELAPKVHVLIPSKPSPLLLKCLQELERVTDPKRARITTTVAFTKNDASTQKSWDEVISWMSENEGCPGLSIRRLSYQIKNIPWTSFAKVMNRLVSEIKPDPQDYLLFLNDDVVFQNDVITLLLDTVERYEKLHNIRVGTAGIRLEYPDGKGLQHAGMLVQQWDDGQLQITHRGWFRTDPSAFCETESVFGCTGACLLIRYDTFFQLGCFNEIWEHDSEDIELNFRALLQGYTNLYVGHARAYHVESATRGRDPAEMMRWEEARKKNLYPLFERHFDKVEPFLQKRVRMLDNIEDWSMKHSVRIWSEFGPADDIFQDPSNAEVLVKQAKFESRYGLKSDDGKLHVLALGSPTGCGYMRLEIPARYLNKYASDMVVFPTMVLCAELINWAHLFVWHIPPATVCEQVRDFLAEKGIPQLVDSDDNCLALDKYNPSKPGIDPEEILNWMNICGRVSVTTPQLLEAYSERTKPGTLFRVLPNCLDFETFPVFDKNFRPDRPLRIGWFGGRSHYCDLKTVVPALKEIKRLFGDSVEIWIFGWDGKFTRMRSSLPTLDYSHLPNVFGDLPYKFVSPVHIEDYHQRLVSLELDIALLPLADIEFNRRGKSGLKFLEAGASMIPVVASPIGPFKHLIVEGETGLFARDTDEWVDRIAALIGDEELREKLGSQARLFVEANCSMGANYRLWEAWYKEAASQFRMR